MCSTDFLRFLLCRLQSSSNCSLRRTFRDTEKKCKKLVSGYGNEKLREKFLIKRSRKVILASKAVLEFFLQTIPSPSKDNLPKVVLAWSSKKSFFFFFKLPTFFGLELVSLHFYENFFPLYRKIRRKKSSVGGQNNFMLGWLLSK